MRMKEPLVWLNGEMIPESKATVPITDRGFVNGDAAYDAFRTWHHQPLFAETYYDRFFASLHYLSIDPGVTRTELGAIVDQVLATNLPLLSKDEDCQVVLRCTRGADHISDVLNPGRATLIVQARTFKIDTAAYRDGVELVTSSIRRTPKDSVSPKPKTHDRLNNVLADLEVKRLNPQARCLMLDLDGWVAEGSSYNVGAVVNGELIAPKDNCLEGRTMQILLELAGKVGIPARYDNLSLFSLYNASEAFITGSSNGMLPVRVADGRRIGTAIPGPVQERLWKAWDELVGLDTREQARRHLSSSPA